MILSIVIGLKKGENMKNRKRWVACIALCVVIGTCIGWQVRASKNHATRYESKVNEESLTSFQKNTQDFYYNQLTEDERIVFEQIISLYSDLDKVEITLENPVSVYNISRIADAVRESQRDNYWNFIFTYCFNSQGEIINLDINQPEEEFHKEQISKILVQFESDCEQLEQNIEKINTYDELKKFLESDLKHNDYKQINEQITKEKEKVVSLVKPGMTEKETVELFEDWIIQNMEYNYKVLEKNDSGLETSQAIGNIQNTSSACILNREGICGGLSDLLVDLCNEVGIEAYSVKGMLSMNQGAAGLHQWVAVKINQMIFYIDPTRDVSLKTRNTFYTKEQFYSREGVKYEPLAYYDY